MTPSQPPPAPAGPPRWAAVTVVIPATWTPEQALAVFELLDDLRETVAALYLDQMQDHLRQEQGNNPAADEADSAAGDELTF
jgi:hypothetical protein